MKKLISLLVLLLLLSCSKEKEGNDCNIVSQQPPIGVNIYAPTHLSLWPESCCEEKGFAWKTDVLNANSDFILVRNVTNDDSSSTSITSIYLKFENRGEYRVFPWESSGVYRFLTYDANNININAIEYDDNYIFYVSDTSGIFLKDKVFIIEPCGHETLTFP